MVIAFLPMILVGAGLLKESMWGIVWFQVAMGILFVQVAAAWLREWPKPWLRETLWFSAGTIAGTAWVIFWIYVDLSWLPQFTTPVSPSGPGASETAAATNPYVILAWLVPLVILVIFIAGMLMNYEFVWERGEASGWLFWLPGKLHLIPRKRDRPQ
jgi:hypothetical protein